MLKGIPKVLTPEMLKILCEMGHDDEIVIADAHFPAEAMGKRVIQYPCISAPEMVEAIVKVMPLDTYVKARSSEIEGFEVQLGEYERFEFYEHAKKAYAIIQTGEERQYGNFMLRKGVVLN